MNSTDERYRDRVRGDFEPFPREALDDSIGARFDAIVSRFPEKIAVCSRRYAWTYDRLNARAHVIAQALAELPTDSPEPIALIFDHDAPAIAAILGILKAGHFYCALDPAASAERNGAILRSLGPRALLCDRANLDGANEPAAGKIPVLNTEDIEDPAPSAASLVAGDLPSDSLAYVFFTSGTTGAPKGVMDSHRNVLHNILRYTNNLQITSADRLTLLQTFGFSGSVSSLFCALLNGGTVYPFDFRRERPATLSDWLAEREITIYHSVPSIFRLIAGEGRRFPRMRLVRLEGDQATLADAMLFQEHFPASCRLVNGLGATECGIVRQFFLGTTSPLATRSLPIGYAVEDMEAAVVDEEGRKTQPGEVGEISVKSRYLAVGYWQDPERTAMAFTHAPGEPDARIYRTGDLGCMDKTGCLEYLGRKDFQEKLRGRRIDLAAIEAALLRAGGVAEAVAAIKRDRDGENQVVAYYTESPGRSVAADQLLQHLHSRVGAEALPCALVKLDRLPLNANGKIDRRALPTPRRRRMTATMPVSARDEQELSLIRLWQEILGLDGIGVEDSFLDLGGDSLQAMRMLSRLRQTCGCEVSILEFFDAPTVSALASRLKENG